MPLRVFGQNNAQEDLGAGRTATVVPPGDFVLVYRFGDSNHPQDWSSPRRASTGGNFPRPTDNELFDEAHLQTHFGRNSTSGNNAPFVSVAISHECLRDNGEGWVQGILENVPHMGIFRVPFASLFRPSPISSATRQETEWLYFDGDVPIQNYLLQFIANPYKP